MGWQAWATHQTVGDGMSRLAPRASEVAGVQVVTGWAGAQEGFQRVARVGGSGWVSVQPGG